MTSRTGSPHHALLALGLCIAFLLASLLAAPSRGVEGRDGSDPGQEADANAPELAVLMRRFATSGGVRAHFKELRHFSILQEPIETEGVLYFAPPAALARYTTAPGVSSIIVAGERVAMRDETGVQIIDLRSSEVARTLVGNFMVVLRGDLPTLTERFEVSFQSSAEAGGGWTLDLVPHSLEARAVVERIRFAGRGIELTSIETSETNGDRTLSVFSEVEVGLEFTDDERDRIFSMEPADKKR